MITKSIIITAKYLINAIKGLFNILLKFVTPTLIALCALCFYIFHFQLLKVPTDVPIVYDDNLKQKNENIITVESLRAKVIFGYLNLLNHTSIIQYQLIGKVSGVPGKRPSIKAVQFGLKQRYDYKKPFVIIGDIQLTPIIEESADKTYEGSPIPYDIKIGHYFKSLDWGANEFYVQAFNAKSSFKLMQMK